MVFNLLYSFGFTCIPVGVGIFFALLYSRYGREPDTGYASTYERDFPGHYSPAFIRPLEKMDKYKRMPLSEDFTACVLWLVFHGYLEMRKLKPKKKLLGGFDEDYHFTFTGKDSKTLPKHLNDLIIFLKMNSESTNQKGHKEFSFNEIERIARRQPQDIAAFFRDWGKQILEDTEKMGFFASCEGEKLFWSTTVLIPIILFIVSFLLVIFFGLALHAYSWAAIFWDSLYFMTIMSMWTGIWGMFVHVALPSALAARTKKGMLHTQKWRAMRKYIHDFSNIEEHPASHIKLWEEYLVYGTALGVADKVAEDMNIVLWPKDRTLRRNPYKMKPKELLPFIKSSAYLTKTLDRSFLKK